MDNTLTITIDAYTKLVKDAFRYEMLKEQMRNCEAWQVSDILERFGINTKEKEKEKHD